MATFPTPTNKFPVVSTEVNLLLNIVKSVEFSAPRLAALAVGILKVCVALTEPMLKSVPAVPVANVCIEVVKPLRVLIEPTVEAIVNQLAPL